MAIEALAPAKLNLALHVTGQRADGYHLLDSLVVFAGVGDVITVDAAGALGLTVTGPEGTGLAADEDNLVLRAARALGSGRGAAITLDKRLPVASGIGGGSADAAATLRALSRLWSVAMPGRDSVLALGADVPVCLAGKPARMRGIGERLDAAPRLPESLAVVLANPRVALPTLDVFRALGKKDNPPMGVMPAAFASAAALSDWLAMQRNDLEAAAQRIAPEISTTLDAIGATGALIARMSGSGATCFGLFDDLGTAGTAADTIRKHHPGWWVAATPVLR